MSQPELKPINWQEVRMLASVVGVRESARRMGLSEEQVKKRCTREGWLSDPEAQVANQRAVAQRSGTSAPIPLSPMSPAALVNAELAALSQKSRLSLARGVAKAAEHVETLQGPDILAESGNVKSIAQTADLVHGWKDAAPQVKIRLDVLGGGAEVQPVDIEATEIEPLSLTEPDLNDLDSY
jgi:hypothetical protein